MSVVEGDRKKSRLEIFTIALDLVKYTLIITKNENVFPLEYRGEITQDIIETAKSIYIDTWEANNVRINTEPKNEMEKLQARQDWLERRALQKKAARNCNRLLALMGIAKTMFHLKNKRIKFWTGKVLAVRGMIRKWSDNDNERYSKLLK